MWTDLISPGCDVAQKEPALLMRALAQQLLAYEGRHSEATDDPTDEAARVFERLRVAVTRFAGSSGFTSLMRRAIALARAEDPTLRQLSVRADGTLEGLKQVSVDALLAIIAQFLGLLVTFVGEPLMLRFVREAWPDASLDDRDGIRGQSHE
ncbi:hypothetical protein E4L95_02695 [Paracoccus liaowanqingii]|uniref:Uncharacterized protein n=1 Tax=Paracoccus liaowanqingii TaxID=2560053 RepID=A0A4Z1CS27_9RHOB|nr:hypothetical protein [Paracoccus liaowanqingii]TGN68046.1 hypothetical protein E4L95_02695 [Paracoccus liaowanqingii]